MISRNSLLPRRNQLLSRFFKFPPARLLFGLAEYLPIQNRQSELMSINSIIHAKVYTIFLVLFYEPDCNNLSGSHLNVQSFLRNRFSAGDGRFIQVQHLKVRPFQIEEKSICLHFSSRVEKTENLHGAFFRRF